MNLPELPEDKRSPMLREVNEGLMVRFINNDLINRAHLDIRKSVVLYDEDGLFEHALSELPDEDVQARLLEQTNVRYWSKGI
jgi:hypothetical protein